MHKNKKEKMGISLLLSFILAAAVFLVVSAVVLKTGFLPGNSWRNYLTGSAYGSLISETAEGKLTELLEEHGLPKEAAGELIQQETLHVTYSRQLEECWEREAEALGQQEEKQTKETEISGQQEEKQTSETEISGQQEEKQIRETEISGRQEEKQTSETGGSGRREEFQEQLKSSIADYLEAQQVNVTEQMETEIRTMAEEAGRIFQRYLNPGWLAQMLKLQKKYQGIFTAAIIAGILAAVLCSLLLWNLHRYKHRALRFILFGMEAAALWSGLFFLALGQKQWIAKSGIAPAAYQNLIRGLTDAGIRNGLLALAAEFWILLMLAVWMKRLKHQIS